ncbi:MAG: S8/S53 family peptidase [Alphaproteobacteria bacterium]|nr:S8/S53 family peptidase [Alphaproteobacteria bacterium]
MPNGQANPSFYVLTIARSNVPKVEKAIQRFMNGESGGTLKPLTTVKYVMARPALQAMRVKYDTPLLMRAFLRNIPGVIMVQQMDGMQVKQMYEVGLLDPDDPDAQISFPPGGVAEHLSLVNAPGAWTFLAKQARAQPLSEICVAHLDTGVTRHPVFGKWTNGTSAGVRPELGLNLLGGGPPFDPVTVNYAGQRGHGTRTMSTMAGANKKTLLGMAHGATFVPYRVTNTSVIDTFSATPLDRALEHAWLANGCRVASISLGDPCNPSKSNAAAMVAAYQRGMIVVAAAGNVTSEVTFPGSHPCTITAGGVNLDRSPWAGGSRGIMVDVCAPANGIFRAETVSVDIKEKYGYGKQGDGTSYATTLVAGAAALWLARWSLAHLERTYPEPWMIVEAFRWCARASAFPPAGWDTNKFGAGILDAHALLQTSLPSAGQLRSRLLTS